MVHKFPFKQGLIVGCGAITFLIKPPSARHKVVSLCMPTGQSTCSTDVLSQFIFICDTDVSYKIKSINE